MTANTSTQLRFGILLLAFTFVSMHSAGARNSKPIRVRVNLVDEFGGVNEFTSSKYVVIDNIKVERRPPVQAGNLTEIVPTLGHKQLGVMEWSGNHRPLVLDGTVEDFVRDAVTIGFNYSGIKVLPADDPQAVSVPHVDVSVVTLWMWATRPENQNRYRYNFIIGTIITSTDPGLAHVGLVRGVGFRNGTGPSTAGPYRRTLLYVMNDYLRSFQQSVGNSLATDGVKAKPNDVGAKGTNSRLAEEVELLDALRDQGSLTVEGYEELRQRAIDSYRNQ